MSHYTNCFNLRLTDGGILLILYSNLRASYYLTLCKRSDDVSALEFLDWSSLTGLSFKNRLLMPGDAAASYDPVTSQGLFKSMTDALFAAGFIVELLFKNRNILADYQKAMVARHRQYRQMREYYYRQETRFPASCFWQKMRSKCMEEDLISA